MRYALQLFEHCLTIRLVQSAGEGSDVEILVEEPWYIWLDEFGGTVKFSQETGLLLEALLRYPEVQYISHHGAFYSAYYEAVLGSMWARVRELIERLGSANWEEARYRELADSEVATLKVLAWAELVPRAKALTALGESYTGVAVLVDLADLKQQLLQSGEVTDYLPLHTLKIGTVVMPEQSAEVRPLPLRRTHGRTGLMEISEAEAERMVTRAIRQAGRPLGSWPSPALTSENVRTALTEIFDNHARYLLRKRLAQIAAVLLLIAVMAISFYAGGHWGR